MSIITRCAWVTSDPLYIAYHDQEWGVPLYDDRMLFEFLILEGMQAGLSWLTILKKRDQFRVCFDNFDAHKMANYDEHKILTLLANPGIIRQRLKITSAIKNAEVLLKLKQDWNSLSEYLWQFVNHQPIKNRWRYHEQIPTYTTLSTQLSHDLKQRGFKFVGKTICYAFMQAVGMVNDHITACFRHAQIQQLVSSRP